MERRRGIFGCDRLHEQGHARQPTRALVKDKELQLPFSLQQQIWTRLPGA